ncbi:MAG: hypothetical protein JWR87_362 [Segetibacter sp.]|nr:hypothetical protein [Segetibacter sp.]
MVTGIVILIIIVASHTCTFFINPGQKFKTAFKSSRLKHTLRKTFNKARKVQVSDTTKFNNDLLLVKKNFLKNLFVKVACYATRLIRLSYFISTAASLAP